MEKEKEKAEYLHNIVKLGKIWNIIEETYNNLKLLKWALK